MTSFPYGQPGTGWRIDSQQEETRTAAGNTVVRGMVIFFHTQYGANGSVFVPDKDYSVDVVRMMVTQRATEMDNVHTLSG